MVQSFEQEIGYFYKYYEGPKVVPIADHLLSSCSNENDLHVVTYVKDFKDVEQLNATKQFRKMN